MNPDRSRGIALNLNVAESIELWFQNVVRFGSGSSKAATASRVKCVQPSSDLVAWYLSRWLLVFEKGWAVSEVVLLSRSSPLIRIHQITSLNAAIFVVESGREGKVSEEQGRGEPLRDYVSWISPKSPSPFFQNLITQSLIGLIFCRVIIVDTSINGSSPSKQDWRHIKKVWYQEIKGRCL